MHKTIFITLTCSVLFYFNQTVWSDDLQRMTFQNPSDYISENLGTSEQKKLHEALHNDTEILSKKDNDESRLQDPINRASVYFHRGVVLYNLKKYQESLDDFNEILSQ